MAIDPFSFGPGGLDPKTSGLARFLQGNGQAPNNLLVPQVKQPQMSMKQRFQGMLPKNPQELFSNPMFLAGVNMLAANQPSLQPQNTAGRFGQALGATGQQVQQSQMQKLQEQYLKSQAGYLDSRAQNPNPETGQNSRYKSPMVTESRRMVIVDGRTGVANYADTGQPWDSETDKLSADLQVVTRPDGSMVIVDMSRGLGSDPSPTPDPTPGPTATQLPPPPLPRRTEDLLSSDEALEQVANRSRVAAASGALGSAEGAGLQLLPGAIVKAEQALDTIDALRVHPGRATATGKTRYAGLQHLKGTQAFDFDVQLKQAQGQVFLTAYDSLRGAGVITEIEGTKAEQAIARMDAGQTDQAFLNALDDLESVIRTGLDVSRQRAGMPVETPGLATGGAATGGAATGVVNWADLK